MSPASSVVCRVSSYSYNIILYRWPRSSSTRTARSRARCRSRARGSGPSAAPPTPTSRSTTPPSRAGALASPLVCPVARTTAAAALARTCACARHARVASRPHLAAPPYRHARVYEEDGGFYIEDLKSTHGTLVAGQRLVPGEPMRLFDGLRVALASSGFEVVPTNTMAAVIAAMKSAQADAARREREKQDAEVRRPAVVCRAARMRTRNRRPPASRASRRAPSSHRPSGRASHS